MRIAVTGASGQLGGQVVGLLDDGSHDIVAMSRTGRSPHERWSQRVSTAGADYADLPALRAAMRGIDTLVFVSGDGPAEKVVLHHQNVVRAAVDSGVSHVVALSGLDADLASPFCYAVTNGSTEQALLDSGCPFTVIRASVFTEFFLRLVEGTRTTGQLRLPAADGRLSLVSQRDVGRCLATMALSPPSNRHHDITGPESLDLTTIAARAERRWGTPITYVNVSPIEYSTQLALAGMDPWWSYAYSSMFASVREQRWAPVSNEYKRLTGHPATPVREVLDRASGADRG